HRGLRRAAVSLTICSDPNAVLNLGSVSAALVRGPKQGAVRKQNSLEDCALRHRADAWDRGLAKFQKSPDDIVIGVAFRLAKHSELFIGIKIHFNRCHSYFPLRVRQE